MRLISLVILCCVLSFTSCTDSQSGVKVVKDFQVQETLSGTRIDLDRAEHLSNMVATAGDYYVFNAIKASYCFQVYDKDFQLVDTLIPKGGGPGELSGIVMYLGQWSGEYSSPNLLVYSDAKRKLVEYSMQSPKQLSTVADLSELKSIYPKFVYKAEDGLIYGVNLPMNGVGGLFSYNPSTQELKISEPAFEFASDLSPFYATQQTMAMDMESRRLFTAYNNYPCVAAYDTDLNIEGRYNIEERINTETLTKDSQYPELINIRCHQGKLIVLYCPQDDEKHSLKVFGTNGEAIASYGVGDAIWYLIDERNNRLLTVHYDNEKDVIYMVGYPLPKTI